MKPTRTLVVGNDRQIKARFPLAARVHNRRLQPNRVSTHKPSEQFDTAPYIALHFRNRRDGALAVRNGNVDALEQRLDAIVSPRTEILFLLRDIMRRKDNLGK
jgi:hypothetical protein